MTGLLIDSEMAEAVVDGLAGVARCGVCGDRCAQYACGQKDPNDVLVVFCSGCVTQFRKQHDLRTTREAARVLRYAAHRGWVDNGAFFERADIGAVVSGMLHDHTWRRHWRD